MAAPTPCSIRAVLRIGTAEIYRQVEKVEDVLESVAIGQDWHGDGARGAVRAPCAMACNWTTPCANAFAR